jgi:hypothetical protein
MKRVIFTTYDDIKRSEDASNTQKVLDSDWLATKSADLAKQKLVDEYFERLVSNKKDYAEKIGVDFIFYHNTMKDFEVDCELEFAKVNLYKHHLMAELANDYDEVLYVDMDVVFNTDLNVFEEHDLSKGIHIRDQDEDIVGKDKAELLFEIIGLRSPTLKYHITKDLLDGKDNHVINTGIMLANAEHIRQIRFIERMHEAIQKIQEIKKNVLSDNIVFSTIVLSYYPNNESIFSWILEKYDIPYVLFDKETWHKLYNDNPEESLNGYMIHFINKQFGRFFKDKTKAIFSLHVDIPTDRLDNPRGYKDNPENKSAITKRQMNEYRDRLLENHQNYCNAIGAEYFHFGRDEEYKEFYKRFPDLSEYDVVNLYKIWLLDKLTKEYDLVTYIDFDCVFHNHADIFEHLPCDYSLCVYYETKKDLGIIDDAGYFATYDKDFRNPQAKYWNAHALLTDEGLNGENYCFNTGVICTSRWAMEQLDYFSDIDEVIARMKELKEDEYGMYPEQIRKSFGYDNESIFSYKVFKNKALIYRMIPTWHTRHYYDNRQSFEINSAAWRQAQTKWQSKCMKEQTVITHFISKNFSLWFNK